MTTAILLYLYVVLGDFLMTGVFLFGVLTFGWGVALLVVEVERIPDGKERVSKFKFIPFCAAFFILASSLVPSKESMAWIIGGSLAFNISQTEEAQKLPDNVLGALNSFLEQYKDQEAINGSDDSN